MRLDLAPQVLSLAMSQETTWREGEEALSPISPASDGREPTVLDLLESLEVLFGEPIESGLAQPAGAVGGGVEGVVHARAQGAGRARARGACRCLVLAAGNLPQAEGSARTASG